MATSNTRLESTWISKENRPKLEPRGLVENAEFRCQVFASYLPEVKIGASTACGGQGPWMALNSNSPHDLVYPIVNASYK
jgi:hypothetical protein